MENGSLNENLDLCDNRLGLFIPEFDLFNLEVSLKMADDGNETKFFVVSSIISTVVLLGKLGPKSSFFEFKITA